MISITETSNINELPSFFNIKKYDNPFFRVLILKYNDKIVGYLSYFIIYERIEIEYVYILDEYRRKGFASMLFDKLLEIASINSCMNITLEVDVTNKSAINLYKKKGFEIASTREKYYGNNDAYLMIKELEV